MAKKKPLGRIYKKGTGTNADKPAKRELSKTKVGGARKPKKKTEDGPGPEDYAAVDKWTAEFEQELKEREEAWEASFAESAPAQPAPAQPRQVRAAPAPAACCRHFSPAHVRARRC